MVSLELFIGVVVALFGAIIGAYVYVHKEVCKSREELAGILKANEKAIGGQINKLANHVETLTTGFQNLQVALTNRLTRIETKLQLSSEIDL